MKKVLLGLVVLSTVSLLHTQSSEAILLSDTSTFSGSETVLTFEGLPNFGPIGNTYSAQGAIFTAGKTTNQFTWANGTSLATSWDWGSEPTDISWDFTVPVNRIGFEMWPDTGFNVEFNVYNGANLLETSSLPYSSGSFHGFEESENISRVVLHASSGTRMFFIDNVRFEGQTAVPEPATMILFGLGGAAMAFIRRKKRHT